MKANELRIGNWVMVFPVKNPQQVCDVMFDSVNTECVFGQHYGEVDPIPLTEEWLLKFGFELINEPNKRYHYGRLCLQFCKSRLYPSGRTFFNNWAILDNLPEHVHQLQNLYFSLTGEELTYGGNK